MSMKHFQQLHNANQPNPTFLSQKQAQCSALNNTIKTLMTLNQLHRLLAINKK
jgi:hypothetical protein